MAQQKKDIEQLRGTSKIFKQIADSHLIGGKTGRAISISGQRLSSFDPLHFVKIHTLFCKLFQHMEMVEALALSNLHCIGPLRYVLSPLSFAARLHHIELSDSDRWLQAGNKSLIFHLNGLSCATSLVSFKISVKSPYYQSRIDTKVCSISSLASLLPRSIEILDLGVSLWSTSTSAGLMPLFTRLPRLTSLTLTRCPTLRTLGNINPSHLRRLMHLNLDAALYSQPFKDLMFVGTLTLATNLQSLKLPRHFGKKTLPAQEVVDAAFSISNLTELVAPLGDSENQAHIPVDLACTGLRSLILHGSPTSIEGLKSLTALTSLELSVMRTDSFETLSALTALVSLSMSELYNEFPDLTPLSILKSLKSLELFSIGDDVFLDFLSCLIGLTKLELYWEDRFPDGVDLNSISALTALVELSTITSCPRDGHLAPHMDALVMNFDRFLALKDLSIPIELDEQAAYLSHLTALTRLLIQNSCPSNQENDGEIMEIRATSILIAASSLPLLSDLHFQDFEYFSDDQGSLKLMSDDEKFFSIAKATFESCFLSSDDLLLIHQIHRLKKLTLEYCRGFTWRSAYALERHGLELNIESDDFEPEEEEDEKREEAVWKDRFFSLNNSLQAQILMEAAMRNPATSLDGPGPVEFGVLRLVCSQWQVLVDRSKESIILDIPALIRSLPIENQQDPSDKKGPNGGSLLHSLTADLEINEADMATEGAETDKESMLDEMPLLIESSSGETLVSVHSPTSSGPPSPPPHPSLSLVTSCLRSLISRLKAMERLTLIHPQLLIEAPVLQPGSQGWHLLDLLLSLNEGKCFTRVEALTLCVPSLSNKELSKLITSSSTTHPIFSLTKSGESSSLGHTFPNLTTLSIFPTEPDKKHLNLCPGCRNKESNLYWMSLAMNPLKRYHLTSFKSLADTLAPLPRFASLHLSNCQGVTSLKPLTTNTLRSKLTNLSLGSLHSEDASKDVSRLTSLTKLCLRGLDEETHDLSPLLSPLTRLKALELSWMDPPGSSMTPVIPVPFLFISARLVIDIASTLPPLPELQMIELNGSCVASFGRMSSECPKISTLELIDVPQELNVKRLAENMGSRLVKLTLISIRIDSIVSLKECILLESLVLSDVRQKKIKLKSSSGKNKDHQSLNLLRNAIPPCGNIVSDLARNTPPRLKDLTLSGLCFFPYWSQEVANDSSLKALMHVRSHSIIRLLVHNPQLVIINLFAAKGLRGRILNLLCIHERSTQFIYYRTQDLHGDVPLNEDPASGAAHTPAPFTPVFDVTQRPNGGRQLLVTDFYFARIREPLPRAVRTSSGRKEPRLKQLKIDEFFSSA